MNIFSRAFVVINRIFGGGAVIGGAGLVLLSMIRAFRFGVDGTFWQFFLLGVAFAFIGILYLKAPLSRKEMARNRLEK